VSVSDSFYIISKRNTKVNRYFCTLYDRTKINISS
jgi:hypothetical protein